MIKRLFCKHDYEVEYSLIENVDIKQSWKAVYTDEDGKTCPAYEYVYKIYKDSTCKKCDKFKSDLVRKITRNGNSAMGKTFYAEIESKYFGKAKLKTKNLKVVK